jgi:hypothetical protein
LANRSKSPISAHNPTAVSVSTPRRHRNRPTCTVQGELGEHRHDLALQLLAAVAERVDRAACVEHRGLRGWPRQRDRHQPGAVTFRPRSSVVEPDPVPQQQLREPVPAPHQVDTDRFASTNQVTQRLLLIARNPNRMQLPGQQQPDEVLGVATIGLDPIPRRAGNLARRRDHALHTTLGEFTREPVPSRASLIRHPHLPRQPLAKRRHLRDLGAHREALQLAGLKRRAPPRRSSSRARPGRRES